PERGARATGGAGTTGDGRTRRSGSGAGGSTHERAPRPTIARDPDGRLGAGRACRRGRNHLSAQRGAARETQRPASPEPVPPPLQGGRTARAPPRTEAPT